jgi:hypothetical protein
VLHFQHQQEKYTKRAYANPDRAFCKTNFAKDWSSYWFYVKVDMCAVPGYDGPAHPLSTPIEALTATSTASYNHRAAGIRNCESAFHLASIFSVDATLLRNSLPLTSG